MCYLRVDGLVVAGPRTISTIARIVVVVVRADIYGTKSAWEELRQPFVDHNVLVGGNGELASTVEQPLVFLGQPWGLAVSTKSPCPVLVDSVPQDSESEKKRVFITTGVTNSCDRKQNQYNKN